MIKKFNEMLSPSKLIKNCFLKTNNGHISISDLYVQFIGDSPNLAHFGDGSSPIYSSRFALSYDEMVDKLVSNNTSKQRLKDIKEDFSKFINNREIGTKIYIKDFINRNDNILECVWDGNRFKCGNMLMFSISDIFNHGIRFIKPENKNIITNWTKIGFTWDIVRKDWIKNKK